MTYGKEEKIMTNSFVANFERKFGGMKVVLSLSLLSLFLRLYLLLIFLPKSTFTPKHCMFWLNENQSNRLLGQLFST